MTNIKLPDEVVNDIVVVMDELEPDTAVLEALTDYLRYRKQLRVLDFEGQFDADPTYDYKEQRRVP
ncbi:hypothetical protein [Deinococcus sp. AJ005]|uniref:hypothetical protein n=1 Tax=Deinococcus sp. AJ005 TaxID=2652443 RepID=UPI00125CABA9|nr:hypothetical protein [Deinococcus sp. AJ005]QFP77754.1 hypothetical protein DAAJ005_15825 [Deinococcus sp. AJ005]